MKGEVDDDCQNDGTDDVSGTDNANNGRINGELT